jgi:phosphate starvation-inducible membrane PsiE
MPCSIIAMDTLSHIVLFGQPPSHPHQLVNNIFLFFLYFIYINKNQNNNNTC